MPTEGVVNVFVDDGRRSRFRDRHVVAVPQQVVDGSGDTLAPRSVNQPLKISLRSLW